MLAAAIVAQATAQAWHTPAAGSAEREKIMNALRVPIQGEAQAPVTFFKVQMRVQGSWAWVVAMAMDKAGKKYLLGKYSSQGVLQRTARGWSVIWWGVSNKTDVVIAARKLAPAAPRGIFFNPPR